MSTPTTDRDVGVAPGPGLLLVDGAVCVLVGPTFAPGGVGALWQVMGEGSPRHVAGWLARQQVETFAVVGDEHGAPVAIWRGAVRVGGGDPASDRLPPPDSAPVEWPLADRTMARVMLWDAPDEWLQRLGAGAVPAGGFEVAVARARASMMATPAAQSAPPAPVAPAPVGAGAVSDDGEPGADEAYDFLFGDSVAAPILEEPLTASSAPAPVPPLPVATDGPEPGDHDGRTVTSAQVAALRSEVPSVTQTTGSTTSRRANVPTVHAVRCPVGHLNPPHAPVCRVCGAQVGDQEHLSVPRPVLGWLRFSSGQRVEVSRPLLVGRSPKAAGAITGEFPELVAVPSPQHDISRVHVEVRLEGWQVLVIDCGSTNGTVVTLPGRQPQLLRAGEPHPIVPGSTVTLGGEETFWFEVDQ